jgi:hypothetical protein
MSPLEFTQRLAALVQPPATAPANDCFAAVNLGRRMPGLGVRRAGLRELNLVASDLSVELACHTTHRPRTGASSPSYKV